MVGIDILWERREHAGEHGTQHQRGDDQQAKPGGPVTQQSFHRPRGSSSVCAISTARFVRMKTKPANTVKLMTAL